jgi:hypothetical protein
VSENQHDVAPTAAHPPAQAEAAGHGKPLAELMAEGPKGTAATGRKGPDLDAEALAAAQQAIAESERALAAAKAQLAAHGQATPPPSRSRRELALRVLLAANVLAMVVVAALPGVRAPSGAGQSDATQPPAAHGAPPAATQTQPRPNDRYLQALLASSNGEHRRAVDLLEQYLADNPRLAPSALINVLMALEYSALRAGDPVAAQGYQRRIQALHDSHKLPDDLVAEAEAAAQSGDQESLRRLWARFLLQQRQIPPALYKKVAEAYLQLGDSYRRQANDAAEALRRQELEAAARDAAAPGADAPGGGR